MPTGTVQITVTDSNSAAILVPGSSVILCMGPCSAGTVGQIVATTSPQTLTTNLGYGPLVEFAALMCLSGAVVLAIKTTNNATGHIVGGTLAALTITTASSATPIVVTTSAPHGLVTGSIVVTAGVTSNTPADGTFVITVTGASTFTLNGSAGTGSGTGGTAQFTGLIYTGIATPGTSVITTTLDATNGCFDDQIVQMNVVTGGTIGTGPIALQFSLDAGRNFGPQVALGTATTFVIPNTGVTLNFAAGTLVTGDILKFATAAPAWNDAGVLVALQAFQNSQYAIAGVGAAYLVGPCAGTDGSTIGADMETLATGYIYNRLMCNGVDASLPVAWGGVGQTETAWITALQSSWSATSQRRICAAAGYYNIPSAYPNAVAGAPRYRRPGGWAMAARQVTLPPQRLCSRVRDGALSAIVVDPVADPKDGFIYHDERVNAGLDASRFATFWTRIGKPGFFVKNPNLMSPPGSNLTILPLGNVLDIACDIIHQSGDEVIDDDLRLNNNGTLFELDARGVETTQSTALQAEMGNMISGFTLAVSRTQNVQATGKVTEDVSIIPRGYALELDATIGFNLPGSASNS